MAQYQICTITQTAHMVMVTVYLDEVFVHWLWPDSNLGQISKQLGRNSFKCKHFMRENHSNRYSNLAIYLNLHILEYHIILPSNRPVAAQIPNTLTHKVSGICSKIPFKIRLRAASAIMCTAFRQHGEKVCRRTESCSFVRFTRAQLCVEVNDATTNFTIQIKHI